WNCATRPENELGADDMSRYLDAAWDDFIDRQIDPFGNTPVFLGIGNHELAAGRTRDEFRRKFQKWLASGPIHLQRIQEAAMKPPFYSTERRPTHGRSAARPETSRAREVLGAAAADRRTPPIIAQASAVTAGLNGQHPAVWERRRLVSPTPDSGDRCPQAPKSLEEEHPCRRHGRRS